MANVGAARRARRQDGRKPEARPTPALRIVERPRRSPPERFSSRDELREALEAHCIDQLGGAKTAQALIAQVTAIRGLAHDQIGRDRVNRLRRALHDARALLALERAGRRKPTAYSEELERVLAAVQKAGAWPADGDDGEIAARRLLVETVDVGRRGPLSNRQLALLSLLSGNGSDWALRAVRGAKKPTVADAVRAEERAIANVRKRVDEARAERQRRARAGTVHARPLTA